MDTTWIDLGGFVITKPVSAGTNLVLAVQCALYYRSRRAAPEARTRWWAGFFLLMSLATLAGVPKHGIAHLLSGPWLLLVLWISNVAGGVSTWCAQRATIADRADEVWRGRLERLVGAQLGLFLLANVWLGPGILVLIVDTALGLLPVIGVELDGLRRGRRDSGWVAAGLIVSILTGVAYLTGLSIGGWVGPVDIAHFLMGASFLLIARGCAAYVPATPAYVAVTPALRRVPDTVGPGARGILPTRNGAHGGGRTAAAVPGGAS